MLVCDDDSLIRTELQTLLEQGGYRVVTVATGEEAIAQAVYPTSRCNFARFTHAGNEWLGNNGSIKRTGRY